MRQRVIAPLSNGSQTSEMPNCLGIARRTSMRLTGNEEPAMLESLQRKHSFHQVDDVGNRMREANQDLYRVIPASKVAVLRYCCWSGFSMRLRSAPIRSGMGQDKW
jgi:hypothetical protein